ncbi:hypothetical protein [Sulfuriroseicoccus oceanibius]|uniref:Uncharacterized protein n=1 Tax=Sulfuriroseicoccus oceanibius TaxID=2707525 RepID=A0A6B3L4J4_9BACT|nr:hypothetical protein [Sulfuriroseicoccus oceanibius]QQL45931.1 hypothetical protein G3M56_004950 [Sulfuriroseicoccus oceanibius]
MRKHITMANQPTTQPSNEPRHSIVPSCLIVACAAVFFVALIVYAIWQGVERSNQIDAFTDPEPTAISIDRLADDSAFEERIGSFSQAVHEGTAYELRVTAADLNHLIATRKTLEELKGQLKVLSIGDGKITARIAYPINRLPWESGQRYMNGEIDVVPETPKGYPIFRVKALRVDGDREIPDWFQEHFSVYNVTERFTLPVENKPMLQQITALTIEGNELVVKTLSWKFGEKE